MLARAAVALMLAAASGPVFAHRAPNSFVRLEFAATRVHAEVLVPRSELAFAMPGEEGPEAFAGYLLRHLAVETPRGAPWIVTIRAVRSTLYFDHEYLVADLEMTPPAGATTREFVLVDDAVTHEVRNHVVVVTETHAENPLLGALQYPARRLTIARTPR